MVVFVAVRGVLLSLPRCTLALLAAHIGALAGCNVVIKTGDLEGGCPGHLAGPKLVKIDQGPAGVDAGAGPLSVPYCIDSTEVTNAHYKAFIDAQGPDAQAHFDGPCASVTSYLPDRVGWPEKGSEDLPASRVNWCQADAYCRWSGKRLCGKIGGGPLLRQFEFDPGISQWFNACSHGGTRAFPYGGGYDPNRCVGPGVATSPRFVATQPGCEGGFSGIFDMSGNVWEWTDTCDDPGGNGFCHASGGGFDSTTAPNNDFACNRSRNWTRTAFATDIGFRCCKDL